jgi:glutathione peroxidase
MKFLFFSLVTATFLLISCSPGKSENMETTQNRSIHSYKIDDIGGDELDLSRYKGKPLLIANIATKCGYTPQLKGLEEIYKEYKSKGLVVLGVPSDEFGGQTPEDNKGVKNFCMINYGVSFPLTTKTSVKGSSKHPLFEKLISSTDDNGEIAWNFEKFLIDSNGYVVKRFKSSVKPGDETVKKSIEKLL